MYINHSLSKSLQQAVSLVSSRGCWRQLPGVPSRGSPSIPRTQEAFREGNARWVLPRKLLLPKLSLKVTAGLSNKSLSLGLQPQW